MGFLRKIINKFFGINLFKIISNIKFILKALNGLEKIFIFKIIPKIFFTKKIEKEKNTLNQKKEEEYKANYIFLYDDWFSRNIKIWLYVFNKYKLNHEKIKYLEIGSFEGRSSLFVLHFLKYANCTFVDPYTDYTPYPGEKAIDMRKVYKSFDDKIKKFDHRAKIMKITSDEFFYNNQDNFDLIFIDGSHYAPDVLKDLNNSYKILKKNGIMILDDFFWDHYKEIKLNPIGAILPFVKLKYNEIKIISLGEQLILEKLV